MVYIPSVKTRPAVALVAAITVLMAGGCGVTNEPTGSADRAASARASLLATFTTTHFRLHPTSGACGAGDTSQPGAPPDLHPIECDLTSPVMALLEHHLDQGLGTGLSSSQKACINRAVTPIEVAALLSGEFGLGRPHAASAVTAFDRQLTAIITQCTPY